MVSMLLCIWVLGPLGQEQEQRRKRTLVLQQSMEYESYTGESFDCQKIEEEALIASRLSLSRKPEATQPCTNPSPQDQVAMFALDLSAPAHSSDEAPPPEPWKTNHRRPTSTASAVVRQASRHSDVRGPRTPFAQTRLSASSSVVSSRSVFTHDLNHNSEGYAKSLKDAHGLVDGEESFTNFSKGEIATGSCTG